MTHDTALSLFGSLSYRYPSPLFASSMHCFWFIRFNWYGLKNPASWLLSVIFGSIVTGTDKPIFWFLVHEHTKVHKLKHWIDLLTFNATGLSGGSSDNSCGTGTAAANAHSAMVIKTKYFHDIICIFVAYFFSVRGNFQLNLQWNKQKNSIYYY